MKYLLLLLALPTLVWGIDSGAALENLKAGNDRFISDQLEHPNLTSMRREAVVSKQKPFATILGCSDSRVPPEILFDQGVGDLFIVRVAGNVAGPVELDSLEFSVLHLGSSLIVVLGHENCGAVHAVMEDQTQDIEAVADLIRPALQNLKGDSLEMAIKANVRNVVAQLKQTKVISNLINQKKVDVVGGYYNLATGKVEFLD